MDLDTIKEGDEGENSTVAGLSEIKVEESSSLQQWFNSILYAERETEKILPEYLIPKVPDLLRKNTSSNEIYEPLVVVIRPYHKEKAAALSDMQKLKLRMACHFVRHCKKSIEEMYKEVRKLHVNAQKTQLYYDPDSMKEVGDEELTQMIFVYGCFIAEFISIIAANCLDVMKISNQEVASMRRDLFLLENQVPYEVLMSLIHMRDGLLDCMIDKFIKPPEFWKAITLPEAVRRYVCALPKLLSRALMFGNVHVWSQYPTNEEEEMEAHYSHLLERLYAHFVDQKLKIGFEAEDYGELSYYSAKDLKKIGIHFKPSNTHALTDIKFERKWLLGVLKLPRIRINASTKSMFLNMVAYETCAYESDKHSVTSYLCFMDSLINNAEDVSMLRSSGIIYNFLGDDKEVVDMFNDMAADLVPNRFAYFEVKKNMRLQIQYMPERWVAELKQVYFRSPWTLIALIVATLAILLTGIQTYFAVFPGAAHK